MPDNETEVSRTPRAPFSVWLEEMKSIRAPQLLGLVGEVATIARTGARAPRNFLGLRANPFSTSSDPTSLVWTTRARKAFDDVAQSIESRRGLILLTGEAGTGKTTLINQLRGWLRKKSMPTAFIFNPLLDPDNFFRFALAEFGIRLDHFSPTNPLVRLQGWLLECYRAGETPVLIVDEAQSLSLPLLEALVLLVNLEMGQEKLIQIVLSGQPELNEKLKRPELRKLHQRIALRCATASFTDEEFRTFIESRLRSAGSDGNPVFSAEALDSIQLYSRKIPRVINLLCEHAVIDACAEQARPIPARIIEEVAHRFQYDSFRPVAPTTRPEPIPAESSISKVPEISEPPVSSASANEQLAARESALEVNVAPPPAVPSEQFVPQAAVPQEPRKTEATIRAAEPPRPSIPPSSAIQIGVNPPINKAADGILAAWKRSSESLLRWLKQPLRTTRQRGDLGTRRA
jgi:general secretion pathway protein A